MSKIQYKMSSKIGPVYLVTSAYGLCGVFWSKQDIPLTHSRIGRAPAMRWMNQAVQELEQYFDGKRKSFRVPLRPEGTEFQLAVWKTLGKIAYGGTCSYKDVAKRVRKPKATRAVGTANGKNPLSIVVPCHRVIAADGSLGGYAGGLERKTQLLNLEKNRERD